METFKEVNYKGYTIRFHYDSDPMSPREWDNFGTIVSFYDREFYFHEEKETLGYSISDYEGFKEYAKENKGLVALPIRAYIHSGITISTGENLGYPFNDAFDSCYVGVIFVTKEKAQKEFGRQYRKKAIKCLESEINVLDDYLTSQVYGYTVLDPQGNETDDSCWGFFGDSGEKYMEQKAKSNIDFNINKAKDVLACR